MLSLTVAYQVTNQYITEGGCELVLVSAHLGARTRGKNQPELAGHDRWQSRAYRIRGSEPGYPNLLETTGYDIDPETGEGRVVNPLGLHGYNCRHSHKPWDRRLRNPYLDENVNLTIDTEENRQRYRLEQRQRAMERAIRQTRRQLQVKALELEADPNNPDLQAEYGALENRLGRQDEAYNRFCQENGLAAQYERLRVTDGDDLETQNRAADLQQYAEYQKVLGENAPKTFAEFQQMKYTDSEAWDDLKTFRRYRKQEPNGSLADALLNKELRDGQLIKGRVIPKQIRKAYILEDKASKRDPAHIMKRMMERLITDDEIQSYVDNAQVCVSQFRGTREVYYSDTGVTVLTKTSDYGEVEWIAKTAWKDADFDESTLKILEVAKKHYGNST